MTKRGSTTHNAPRPISPYERAQLYAAGWQSHFDGLVLTHDMLPGEGYQPHEAVRLQARRQLRPVAASRTNQ